MSLAALARRLADAGTPMDAIIMALEAVEAEQSRAAEGRAKAAERKRRQRERDAGVTVTGQSQDNPETAPFPAPPNENNLTPPTHTPEKQTPRARGKHPMPSDWEPKPLTGDTAQTVAAWPPGALERELARFRDWAAGGGPNTRKENWDATWRNWVRRAQDEGRYRERSTGNRSEGGSRTAGAVAAVMERLGDRATTSAALADRRSDRPTPSLPSPVRPGWNEPGRAR